MMIEIDRLRESIQHIADALIECLPEAVDRANDAIYALIKQYTEQKSIDWKINGRVAHLAYYHKKERVRKKNMHRLDRMEGEKK